jgi:hypothetical protein
VFAWGWALLGATGTVDANAMTLEGSCWLLCDSVARRSASLAVPLKPN